MIHEKIEIAVDGCEEKAQLYTYFLDNSEEIDPQRVRPVILICPGGGYNMTSDREAEPLAVQFLAMGYHAAVLRYSVAPARYPLALLQLAKSVLFLKENAARFHIDPDKIILQGSSAGGHLAASLGVFWNRDFLSGALHTKKEQLRPAGLLLCYPVITSGPFAHDGSFLSLLGEEYESKKDMLSLETQVNADTPAAFLWHTTPDDTVPVQNSVMFYSALAEHQVPAELHIYPTGGHGLSLATAETAIQNDYGIVPECASWLSLAKTWLGNL